MVIGNGYQQTYAGEYHRTSNVNLGRGSLQLRQPLLSAV